MSTRLPWTSCFSIRIAAASITLAAVLFAGSCKSLGDAGPVDFGAVSIELELLEGDIVSASKLYEGVDPWRVAQLVSLAGYVHTAREIVEARAQGVESPLSLAEHIGVGMDIVEELLVASSDDPERQARIRIVAFAAEAMLRRLDARTR